MGFGHGPLSGTPKFAELYALNDIPDLSVYGLGNDQVIDVFGDINADGTGTPWEYTLGWVHRKPGTGPDGDTFVPDNREFSDLDVFSDTLDGSAFLRGGSTPLDKMVLDTESTETNTEYAECFLLIIRPLCGSVSSLRTLCPENV